MDRPARLRRLTLDGQLVSYWDREAARLDALAAASQFGWQRRRYARKAAQAREQAARSRVRETARGHGGSSRRPTTRDRTAPIRADPTTARHSRS